MFGAILFHSLHLLLRSMFDFCHDTGLGLFPATWTSKSQSGVRRNSSGVVSVERSSQPAFLLLASTLLGVVESNENEATGDSSTKKTRRERARAGNAYEHKYFHHLESRISTTHCMHRPSAHLPIIANSDSYKETNNNASRITLSLRDSNVKRRQRSDSQPSDNCIHRSIEQVFF